MEVIEAMMQDDNLVQYRNEIATSYQELIIDGKQCYMEMNHGKWWQTTEDYIRSLHGDDSCLLPIILHIDGTTLDATNKHSADPVSISLGNFSVNIRVT